VPRKLRIEYPGAMYHVMNRGDRREDIFQDDEDRKRFLATLGEACRKTGWQVHGYCLMRNHFHFGEAVQEAEAVQASGW
jgi:putative transposase